MRYCEVSVDANGVLSLARNGVQGPASKQEQAMYDHLSMIIDDPAEVRIKVVENKRLILGGNFVKEQIDIADVEAFGCPARGASAQSVLMHELSEQYAKQALGENDFSTAHRYAIGVEGEIAGAHRGTDRWQNNDKRMYVNMPYIYDDGSVTITTVSLKPNYTDLRIYRAESTVQLYNQY